MHAFEAQFFGSPDWNKQKMQKGTSFAHRKPCLNRKPCLGGETKSLSDEKQRVIFIS